MVKTVSLDETTEADVWAWPIRGPRHHHKKVEHANRRLANLARYFQWPVVRRLQVDPACLARAKQPVPHAKILSEQQFRPLLLRPALHRQIAVCVNRAMLRGCLYPWLCVF